MSIKSLHEMAFDKLPNHRLNPLIYNNFTKLDFVRLGNEGRVNNIPKPHFMTEKEYGINRTQYQRDKQSHLYRGVARLDGKPNLSTLAKHKVDTLRNRIIPVRLV